MLPFLKNKDGNNNAGVIVQTRAPDEKPENKDDQSEAIESCAQELIRAVHARDSKAVAQAMRDAFDILETLPHDEIDHDEDYDSQNIKAAKGNE